jgi:desumoylating isopeptidase 1
MVEPHFHSLSRSHTNITFLQIDTQRAFPISQQHQITATPTFKTFLNGNLLSEWKGANISALDSNLSRLIEAARPLLPPSLRGHYSQSPILFARPPPMDKVMPKLPSGVFPKPLLDSISVFLSAKGDTDVLVPPLIAWAECQRKLDYNVENAWMVIDLLRAAVADRRVSGWFAVDGLDTLADVIRKVSSRDEGEWQLRVVTVQFVFRFLGLTNYQIANIFSTPLLTVSTIHPFLPEMVEFLTSSILSSGTSPKLNLVKAAASALFNLSRLCLEESVAPSEDEILSIVVALVESLKTLLEKKAAESKDLERLLVVCVGGYSVLGRDASAIREVLEGIEAGDIIGRIDGSVSKEVVNLLSSK